MACTRQRLPLRVDGMAVTIVALVLAAVSWALAQASGPVTTAPPDACSGEPTRLILGDDQPPMVVFTRQPDDVTLCHCADDRDRTLQCQYRLLRQPLSGGASVAVQWWKDGRQLSVAGNATTLYPGRCADGGLACLDAAAGSYQCRLVVSLAQRSGVIRSRTAIVRTVDLPSSHTSVTVRTPSAGATGRTAVARCVVSDGKGNAIPLEWLQGMTVTWKLINKRVWTQRTVTVTSLIGVLEAGVIQERMMPGAANLTLMAFPDASLMLSSDALHSLNDTAVMCGMDVQTVDNRQRTILNVRRPDPGQPLYVPQATGFELALPANLTLVVGSATVLTCRGRGYGYVAWTISGERCRTGVVQNISGLTVLLRPDTSLQVQARRPNLHVAVACEVVDGEGLVRLAVSSAVLSAEGAPIPLTQTPSFSELVFQGEKLELVCPVAMSGSWPPATISWHRFGESGALPTSSSLNTVVHAPGLYQCIAGNRLGSWQHTFFVQPKGPAAFSGVSSGVTFSFRSGFSSTVLISNWVTNTTQWPIMRLQLSDGRSSHPYDCICDSQACPSARSSGLPRLLQTFNLHNCLKKSYPPALGNLRQLEVCVIEYPPQDTTAWASLTMAVPNCIFDTLNATRFGLSWTIPSAACQAGVGVMRIQVSAKQCRDSACTDAPSVWQQPIDIFTVDDALSQYHVTVADGTVTMRFQDSQSAQFVASEKYVVSATITTLNGVSSLKSTIRPERTYPHGEVHSLSTVVESNNVVLSWEMPGSRAWSDWGIVNVSLAVQLRYGDLESVRCARHWRAMNLSALVSGSSYRYRLALVPAQLCGDEEKLSDGLYWSNYPYQAWWTVYIPAPAVTGKTVSPRTTITPQLSVSSASPAMQNVSQNYELKFVVAIGSGCVIVGAILSMLFFWLGPKCWRRIAKSRSSPPGRHGTESVALIRQRGRNGAGRKLPRRPDESDSDSETSSTMSCSPEHIAPNRPTMGDNFSPYANHEQQQQPRAETVSLSSLSSCGANDLVRRNSRGAGRRDREFMSGTDDTGDYGTGSHAQGKHWTGNVAVPGVHVALAGLESSADIDSSPYSRRLPGGVRLQHPQQQQPNEHQQHQRQEHQRQEQQRKPVANKPDSSQELYQHGYSTRSQAVPSSTRPSVGSVYSPSSPRGQGLSGNTRLISIGPARPAVPAQPRPILSPREDGESVDGFDGPLVLLSSRSPSATRSGGALLQQQQPAVVSALLSSSPPSVSVACSIQDGPQSRAPAITSAACSIQDGPQSRAPAITSADSLISQPLTSPTNTYAFPRCEQQRSVAQAQRPLPSASSTVRLSAGILVEPISGPGAAAAIVAGAGYTDYWPAKPADAPAPNVPLVAGVSWDCRAAHDLRPAVASRAATPPPPLSSWSESSVGGMSSGPGSLLRLRNLATDSPRSASPLVTPRRAPSNTDILNTLLGSIVGNEFDDDDDDDDDLEQERELGADLDSGVPEETSFTQAPPVSAFLASTAASSQAVYVSAGQGLAVAPKAPAPGLAIHEVCASLDQALTASSTRLAPSSAILTSPVPCGSALTELASLHQAPSGVATREEPQPITREARAWTVEEEVSQLPSQTVHTVPTLVSSAAVILATQIASIPTFPEAAEKVTRSHSSLTEDTGAHSKPPSAIDVNVGSGGDGKPVFDLRWLGGFHPNVGDDDDVMGGDGEYYN